MNKGMVAGHQRLHQMGAFRYKKPVFPAVLFIPKAVDHFNLCLGGHLICFHCRYK
jgi:hypothetical protein